MPKIIKKTDGYPKLFNNIFANPDLNPAEKCVLIVLLDVFEPKKNFSQLSNKMIEEPTNISRNTTKRVLNSLIQKKWIKRGKRIGQNYRWFLNAKCFPTKKEVSEYLKTCYN